MFKTYIYMYTNYKNAKESAKGLWLAASIQATLQYNNVMFLKNCIRRGEDGEKK